MPYITERWSGGMLTNFRTIRKAIKKMKAIDVMEKDGTFESLPKKEVIKLMLKKDRLEKFLGGIKEMTTLPAALFIIDPKKEKIAIHEARLLGIPVVGVVDTDLFRIYLWVT